MVPVLSPQILNRDPQSAFRLPESQLGSTHSPVTLFLQQQKQARAASSKSRSRGMPMPRTKPRISSSCLSFFWTLSATVEKCKPNLSELSCFPHSLASLLISLSAGTHPAAGWTHLIRRTAFLPRLSCRYKHTCSHRRC